MTFRIFLFLMIYEIRFMKKVNTMYKVQLIFKNKQKLKFEFSIHVFILFKMEYFMSNKFHGTVQATSYRTFHSALLTNSILLLLHFVLSMYRYKFSN